MKITLVHPPLDDPTLPYHSTAYLAGHLRHNGFTDVTTRDLNIEFVDYCLDPRVVSAFCEDAELRLKQFASMPRLDLPGQEEFLRLWKASRDDPEAPRRAARELRRRELFLDYERYVENVRTVERYCRLIGSLCYPAEIRNFRQYTMGNFSLYSFEDLFNEDLSARTCYPLARYFQERLLGDGDINGSECIGISIIYDHQLSHALWLARAIKRRWPDKFLVLGGTAVSAIYKHAKDKAALRRFFELSDAIVVGEGETAICEIADSAGDPSGARPFTNTLTYDRQRAEVRLPDRIHYENVPSLGAPLYQHPWDLYLAPARGINYAPTRGCYWNRCTFCDYGLNTDKPTSPWRERRVEQVVADLTHVVKSQAIEYVYFAVDVMAPGYLERLADAIVAADLDIRWATELRMEKIFSADRCKRMARAGCVCVSFGMESGNQRVLDLIDKGTRVSCMADTMKNFGQTSVAVQLMAFKGFPTETAEEYGETVKFIRTHRDLWSAGGLGDFVLTGTAIIAKEPARFGLKLIETQNVDVARMIDYVEETSDRRSQLLLEDGDSSFDESRDVFPATLGRPWAGGIDTLHSMIYYDEHGKDVFKDHALPPRERSERDRPPDLADGFVQPLGRLTESCYDIAQILANEAAHRAHIKDVRAARREPTFGDFQEWQREVPSLANDPGRRDAYIVCEDKCKRLPPLLRKVIAITANGTMTIGEVLARLDPAARTMVEKSLERLYASRFIDIITTGAPERAADEQRCTNV